MERNELIKAFFKEHYYISKNFITEKESLNVLKEVNSLVYVNIFRKVYGAFDSKRSQSIFTGRTGNSFKEIVQKVKLQQDTKEIFVKWTQNILGKRRANY